MTFPRLWLAALLLAVALPVLPQERREAPPLPYRYLGRMVEGGKTIVLLARGDETFAVRPGQQFGGGRWKLERVTEHEVVFVYLPLRAQRAIQL